MTEIRNEDEAVAHAVKAMGVQRTGCTLGGHLGLDYSAVFAEFERLDARLAHEPRSMGRAVIQHLPPAVELHNAAMIVPDGRIAACIVDYLSLVDIRPEGRLRHGIRKACGLMLAPYLGISVIIVFSAFEDEAALVEIMVLLCHQAIHHR